MGMATKKSNNKARAKAFTSLVLILPLLSTCDLFKVGLGNKVDTEPPTLAISSPANGAYVTGMAKLAGTVSDDSGVKSVSAYITFSSPDISAVTKPAAIGDGKWSIDLDSAAIAPNAETNATIVVTAVDTANKPASQRIILYFDNKAPAIKLTSPTKANLDSADYYLNGSARFKGSADTDVKSVVLEAGGLEFRPNNDNLASFSIQVDTQLFSAGAGGVAADAANASVLSVPYTLYAVDNAGNKSVEYKGSFRVWQDSDSPGIAFVSSVAAGKRYSARQSLDLSSFSTNKFEPGAEIKGTIADDDGIDLASVKASLSASSGASKAFQSSDGSLKVAAKETNGEGYATSASWSFTVPADFPLGLYSLGLSASDLAEAKLSPLAASVARGAGMSPAVSIPATPSAKSGALSDILFIVKAGSPIAGLSTLAAKNGASYPASTSGLYLPSGAVTLSGVASDAFGLQSIKYSESKSGPWTTPASCAFAAAPTKQSWSFTLEGLADGNHTIYVCAANALGEVTGSPDIAAFSVDTTGPAILVSRPQPGAAVEASTYDVSGKCTDAGAGVGSVEYSLDKATWKATDGTGDWNAKTDIGATEGSRILYFRAKDKLGNESSSSVTFYYDLNYPVLSETVVNSTALSYVKNNAGTYNLAFGGSASDTNALSASAPLAVNVNGGGATAISVGANGAWSYSFCANTLADGDYILSFTATDVASKATTLSRNVRVDRTPPVVHVAPIGGYQSGVIGISGDYAENNIEGIEYRLGSDAGAWSKASVASATAWNGSLDLAAAPEGLNTLYVRAFDKAGNCSAEATSAVLVDKANPRATETLHGEALIRTRDSVTFSGIADDAAVTPGRSASSAVLTYSLNNGTAVSVTTSSPGNALAWNPATGAWSWTLSNKLGDGFYAITLTVTDDAKKTASVSRNVQLDTTAPSLGVSKPTEGDWTTQQKYGINGSAIDAGVGLPATGAVEYSVDGGATWSAASGATSWSAEADLGASEGQKDIVVRATDLLGNQYTSGVFRVFYDKFYPELSESGVAGDANKTAAFSLSTRASLSFSGIASDSDALAASKALVVSVDGGTETEIAVGSGGSWSYTFNVDASSHAQDGTHTFVFTAKDIANKTTSLARTVTVDTRAPTSEIATPANLGSGESAYWLSGATASIGGGAGDSGAGATGVAAVYYAIAAKGPTKPDFSASTWKLAAGASNWNSTIKLSGTDGIGEGEFSLYVVAVDAIGNVQEKASARDFGVDQNPPTVTEGHAATSATKTAFTLSGRIADSNALRSLVITEQKGSASPESVSLSSPASLGLKDQDWSSVSLPLHGVADGSYTYVITVTDVAGKTTSTTRTVSIDRTPPETLEIGSPSAGQTGPNAIYGAAYTFKGRVADSGVGVAKLYYLIDKAPAAPSGTSGYAALATGDGNWSFTDDFDTDGSGPDSGRAEGSWYLHVKAEDKAGNLTADDAAITLAFDIDQANPVLTESLINTASQVSRNATVDFGGSVSDTNALSGSEALVISCSQNDGPAASVPVTFSGPSWSCSLPVDPVSHKNDGVYELTLTAKDIVGKETVLTRRVLVDTRSPDLDIVTPAPAEIVGTTSYRISGTIDDHGGKGVSSLSWSIDSADGVGGTWKAISAAGNWSAAGVDFAGTKQGPRTLYVRASDGLNPATVKSVSFQYDTEPPRLDVNPTPSYAKTGFDITWTASDSNALSSVALTGQKGNGAAQTLVLKKDAEAASFSYPVAPAGDGADDGTWTYTITATDAAGRTRVETRSVVVDLTKPEKPSITSSPGDFVGSSLTVNGGARDATSGLSGIHYKIDGGDEISGAFTGTENWYGTISLLNIGADRHSLAEGPHTLSVWTFDRAGNESEPASQGFLVDRFDPTVTESAIAGAVDESVNAASALKAGSFTLSGSIGDTNALKSLIISEKKGNDASVPVALASPSSVSGTSASWKTLPLPTAGAADGTYRYTITVTDTAGKSASMTRTVTIDTKAPDILAVDDSSKGHTGTKALSGSSYTFRGSVADSGTGVSKVYYLIDQNQDAAAGTAGYKAITPDGGSWSILQLLDVDGKPGSDELAEGSWHLHLKAADKAGNVTDDAAAVNLDFDIDQTAPSVAVQAPSSAYYGNTLSLSGTTSDSDRVVAVKYSLDGTTYSEVSAFNWDASARKGAWSMDAIDISSVSDGTFLVYLKSIDLYGRSSEDIARVSVSVTKDTKGPTIAVESPADKATVNGTISLSGTTSDANAYGDSYWWIGKGAAPADLSGWTKFSGTISTSKQFNWKLPSFDTKALPDGSGYHFRVLAFDAAGNRSEIDYALTVDQLSDIPAVTLAGLDPAKAAKRNLLGANPIISGTIVDDDAVDVSTIRISFDGVTWIAPNGSLGSDARTVSFSHTLSPAQAAEGTAHDFYVTAKDVNGTPVYADSTGAIVGSGGHEYVKASYWVDAGAPTIAIAAPAANSLVAGAITMSGTVADGSVVTGLLVSTDGGASYSSDNVSYAMALGGGSWSWTGNLSDKPSGDFLLKVEAIDEFGNTRIVDLTVKIDKTAPSVSFIAPSAPGAKLNGSVSFSGTSGDENGLASILYWIGTSVTTPPASSSEWLPAGGDASSWKVAFDSKSKADGSYAFWIRSTDKAGNKTEASLPFVIDQGSDAPVLGFTLPAQDGTTSFASIPFTVTGSVQDDDGIKSLEYKLPGDAEWTTLQVWASPFPTTAQTWSLKIDSISNGTGKSFSLRATDCKRETAYYQSVVASPTFTVAAASPELSIASPVTAAYYGEGASIKVAGTVVDGNVGGTITKLSYAFDGDAAWTDFDTSSHTGSYSWSTTVSVPASRPDGILKIRIKALNAGGNYGIATVDVNVDKTAPSVDAVLVTKTLADNKVNGSIAASGTASDSASLDRVALRVQGTDADGKDYDRSFPNVGSSTWSKSIDTVLFKDKTVLTLTATAYDKAGNASAPASKTVTIDQATNAPSISFSNLDPDGKTYYKARSGKILGTITDDDGLASFQYRFDDVGAWTTVAVADGVTSEPFDIPYDPFADGAHEGIHSIQIKALDIADANSSAGQVATTGALVTFRIDTVQPALATSSPVAGSFKNADFTVLGSSGDANGIAKIEFSLDGGVTYKDCSAPANGSFEPGTGAWTAKISTAAGSGDYDLWFRATDGSGSTGTASLHIIVDKTAPAVDSMAVTKTLSGGKVNGSIVVSGAASDAHLDRVELRVQGTKADGSAWDDTAKVGASSWTSTIDTAAFKDGSSLILTATAFDAAGNASKSEVKTVTVDQSTNSPVIAFSNLALDGSTYFKADGKVSGSITDDDGVASVTYRFDDTGPWTTVNLGGATTETFSFAYTALADGAHRIQLVAADNEDAASSVKTQSVTTALIVFRIDRTKPTLAISSPAMSSYQCGTFMVQGTAGDANGIKAVQVKVDSGAPASCAYSSEDGTWKASLDPSSLTEGSHTITVVATDMSGDDRDAQRSFTYDKSAPLITVLTPGKGSDVNGKLIFKGTTNDTYGVSKVEYKIGKSSQWITLADQTYNWSVTFNPIDAYGTPDYATETAPGSNIWDLVLYVRATDVAGNVATMSDYSLIVDPARDMPTASFVQPSNADTVGGIVRVSGTSYDDDAVKRVEMAFDMDNDGGFGGPGDVWPSKAGFTPPTALTQVEASALAAQSPSAANYASETIKDGATTAWYAANQSAGSWSNWFLNINQGGEFDPAAGTTRTIRIKVRAIDTKDGASYGIAGLSEVISVTFDANVPRIENINYTSGMIVGGRINLTATAKDEGGISSIKVKNEGGSEAARELVGTSYATKLASSDPGYEAGYVKYRIAYPIDTAALFPAASGVLYLSLESTDNSAHTTKTYLNLQVDNIVPTGAYSSTSTISVNGSSFENMSGTAYNLAGKAYDSGTVSGVNKIVAYILRNSSVYDARTSGRSTAVLDASSLPDRSSKIVAAGSFTTGQLYVVVSAGDTDFTGIGARRSEVGEVFCATGKGSGTGRAIPLADACVITEAGSTDFTAMGAPRNAVGTVFVPTGPGSGTGKAIPADYAVFIDKFNEGGATDGDGDGYLENLSLAGSEYSWYAKVNTANMPDGPATVCYNVLDRAGNSSSYSESAFVANNAPSIASLTLGTDLDGDGKHLSAGETVPVATAKLSAVASNFIVRNKHLYLSFNLGGGAVNGTLTYTVSYGGREVCSGTTPTAEINNFVSPVEIPDTITTGNVITNGATFVLRVTDSVGLTSGDLALGMDIDNNDDIKPSIAVAPIGWTFPSGTDAAKEASGLSPVSAYADNLVAVSPASRSSWEGHVEYAADSGYHNSGAPGSQGFDADVSGKIKLRGKAWDNQRIAKITVAFNCDFDADADGLAEVKSGTPIELALWDSKTKQLVPTCDGSLESGSQGSHNWSFHLADKASPEVDLANGHAVNWVFEWNTAGIKTVAQKDVVATFAASDVTNWNEPSLGRAYSIADKGRTVSASVTPALQVDVVPYITSVTNKPGQGLNNSVLRSSTGKYAMDVNDKATFNAAGFNLGSSDYEPSSYVTAGAVSGVPSYPSDQNPATALSSSTLVTVAKTMATVRSGYLTVFVNSVPSINNLNANNNYSGPEAAKTAYNSEADSGKPNSAQWTDDRYLWFWQGTTTGFGENQTYYYPSMLMSGSQPIFAYCNNNDGYTWRSTGDSTSEQRVGRWYARNAVLGATSDGKYVMVSNEDNFSGRNAGFLHVDLNDTKQTAAVGAYDSSWSSGTGVIELCGVEWDGTAAGGDAESRQLNRFMYPNLIVSGQSSGGQLYISYYDAHPDVQQIQFFALKMKSTSASNLPTTTTGGWSSYTYELPDDYKIASSGNMAVTGTKNSSSQYTAMALAGSDVAIAYYDSSSTTLKLAYSSDAVLSSGLANTSATWKTLTVDSSALCGANVSMAYDSAGNCLYLAYADASNADLKLARVDWGTKTSCSIVVDSYNSVGIWTKVQMINGLPYVSYYNNSYNGTTSSIKVAYPVSAVMKPGADPATEKFSGDWECMSVPASTIPQGGKEEFARTMLGAYTTKVNNANVTEPVVAWLGTPRIEYAKLQPSQ